MIKKDIDDRLHEILSSFYIKFSHADSLSTDRVTTLNITILKLKRLFEEHYRLNTKESVFSNDNNYNKNSIFIQCEQCHKHEQTTLESIEFIGQETNNKLLCKICYLNYKGFITTNIIDNNNNEGRENI